MDFWNLKYCSCHNYRIEGSRCNYFMQIYMFIVCIFYYFTIYVYIIKIKVKNK